MEGEIKVTNTNLSRKLKPVGIIGRKEHTSLCRSIVETFIYKTDFTNTEMYLQKMDNGQLKQKGKCFNTHLNITKMIKKSKVVFELSVICSCGRSVGRKSRVIEVFHRQIQ